MLKTGLIYKKRENMNYSKIFIMLLIAVSGFAMPKIVGQDLVASPNIITNSGFENSTNKITDCGNKTGGQEK